MYIVDVRVEVPLTARRHPNPAQLDQVATQVTTACWSEYILVHPQSWSARWDWEFPFWVLLFYSHASLGSLVLIPYKQQLQPGS